MNRAVGVLISLAAVGASIVAGPTTVSAGAPRPPAWPADAVPGSVLVTTASDTVASDLVASAGGVTMGRVARLDVEPGHEARVASSLAERPGVVAAEPDHRRTIERVPSDPDFPRQWSHTIARAPAAWDVTTGSATVRVGILDVGIDGRQPDLAGNLVSQVDVSSGEAVGVALGSDNDPCAIGHGTEVAGVVGAVGDNGTSVAGVAWRVGLVDIAAADRTRCGTFTDSAIIAGIDHAAASGVSVLNMSLGSPGDACPTAIQASVDAARAAGVVVVAAAGNENRTLPGATSVPASCNGVISVAAVGDTGAVASYSNVNDWVDIAAGGGDVPPSRSVLTTGRDGASVEHRGTSYSSPYIAGVAALVLSVRPTLTPDQVEAVLERTAQGGGVHTNQLGWGIVDAGAAVSLVASGAALPALPPSRPFPVGLVARVGPPDGVTDAERQAVAMSINAFDDGTARHAVLARDDDYADALAGSSLGFGHGPVLFTPATGPLHPATRDELQRVLKPGSTVYILGGTAAVPAGVDAEVSALGFVPRRLAGEHRAATAAIVSQEVQRRVVELGFQAEDTAIVVTDHDWPDAATAGALGSWYGMPILLSATAAPAPETTAELQRLAPRRVLVVGGTAAVSDAAFTAMATAVPSASFARLAGDDRIGTALAVAAEYRRLFQAEFGFDPIVAVAVNLRRADAFAHVLSATDIIGSQSGLFLPIDGEKGDVVPLGTRQLACSLEPSRGIVAGGVDVIASSTKDTLTRLLERTERC